MRAPDNRMKTARASAGPCRSVVCPDGAQVPLASIARPPSDTAVRARITPIASAARSRSSPSAPHSATVAAVGLLGGRPPGDRGTGPQSRCERR
jgi:hypothetical protein